MARNTTTDPALELLEELEADVAVDVPVSAVTARDLEVHRLMRERDHADGCPVVDTPGYRGAARVEAYAETIIAARPELRNAGFDKGDVVVVARCAECGFLRYFRPPAGASREKAVNALLAERIRERTGAAPAAASGDVDTTL